MLTKVYIIVFEPKWSPINNPLPNHPAIFIKAPPPPNKNIYDMWYDLYIIYNSKKHHSSLSLPKEADSGESGSG